MKKLFFLWMALCLVLAVSSWLWGQGAPWSSLTELAMTPAVDDLLSLIDKSDTTMSPNGTNKKITYANFMSGNAATATALAANGANCAAGQYPLGVNASGAVESCTADDDDPEAGDVTWSDLTDEGTHTDGQYCTYASGTGFISCNSTPAGSGDITDVWGCTTGNCNAITGAAGDSFDAGSADSSNPCVETTDCSGVTGEGLCCWDTNDNILYFGDGAAATAVGPGAGGGAPTDAQYVTLATNGTLTQERVLTMGAGGGLDLTDGGAGSTVTIAPDLTPSSGSATLEEAEDALQVKYNSTYFTEGASGLSLLSVSGVTGANEDSVSLTDVQTATTSDFHNIGGTDDDDPESGDVAWTDLTDDGTFADEYLCSYEATGTRLDCDIDSSGWDKDSSNDLTTSTSWGGGLGGTGSSPTVDSDGDWTAHGSYPADCSAGNFVRGLGDTLTCAADDDDPESGDVGWSDLTDQGTHTDGKICSYASGTGYISCNSDDDDVPEAADYSNLTGGDGIANSPTGTLAVDLLTPGADADSSETDTPSGLEIVSGKLTLIRGCGDDQILKWDETADDWNCEADATGAGGSAIVFDIGDDGGNDSTDVNEIATSGDTNAIFTEPSADKILIDLTKDWPKADAADALAANPTDCSANQFANAIAASGNLTCASIADADVPDGITVTSANSVEGTDLGTLTDGKACTYDLTGTEIDCNTDFQPLEATLTDIADGTIAENLVNTANPWADDEVSDTLTCSNLEGTDFGTLTNGYLCTYDSSGTEVDCNTAPSTYQPADADLTTWASVTPGTGVATALGNNVNATGGVPTVDGSATLTTKTIDADDNVLQDLPLQKDFGITDPADDDDMLIFKAARAMTITDIHCIIGGGTSITLDIQECSSSGASCSTVDAAITCDSDGAEDDGSFTNGSIDAGDWVKMVLGAPSGTVPDLTFSIYYKESW